jgi:structural maintenance of chromosome 1
VVCQIKNIDSLSAFEASRKEARMCRQEFEQVKKRRCDLFSQCFEHVSISIDHIYKKLCRNDSAQVRASTKILQEFVVLMFLVVFFFPLAGNK